MEWNAHKETIFSVCWDFVCWEKSERNRVLKTRDNLILQLEKTIMEGILETF